MRPGVRRAAQMAAGIAALVVAAGAVPLQTAVAADDSAVDLPVLRRWTGDYPVARLGLLPERQRGTRVGYFGDRCAFAKVWKAFRPGEDLPAVDFGGNLVVFSRNVRFFNRTSIAKVRLRDGVAEILAIETLSAIPIGDNVAMALAEVPRAGIRFLAAAPEPIPVVEPDTAPDPRDADYTIDGRRICLRDGRYEEEAGPGSAARTEVRVLGHPAHGDLDGDGDEDAALFLAYAPGGSGTFYYAAAAIREDGAYRGTNAVLLGDRISPGRMEIRNGVVLVEYADRRPGDPMTQSPCEAGTTAMVLRGGRLTKTGPSGGGVVR